MCERHEQSTRYEVEKKITALGEDIINFKLKQQADEKRFNKTFESLESDISELQQNDAEIISSLSETKYDLETKVKRVEKEVSDLGKL